MVFRRVLSLMYGILSVRGNPQSEGKALMPGGKNPRSQPGLAAVSQRDPGSHVGLVRRGSSRRHGVGLARFIVTAPKCA